MGPVPPVARLGPGVGPERGERLRLDQLVDDGLETGLVDEVEVVHDLGALVAEVAEAPESRRSTHAASPIAGAGRRDSTPARDAMRGRTKRPLTTLG